MPLGSIIGPVMIGPSSSHTAGAVRIGQMARICWGDSTQKIKKVDIFMRGSFASTGYGHGTDKAILAGLLGSAPDCPDVRDGIGIALREKMNFEFLTEEAEGAHPNSARIVITGSCGRTMETVASSVGGGAVVLEELDGFSIGISGLLPSIIIMNKDVRGVVGAVASCMSYYDVNIATMKLHRDTRGGLATMVIEVDSDYELPISGLKAAHPAIVKVIALPKIA